MEVLLRPTIRRPLEIARQYIANPDRCQRTTVLRAHYDKSLFPFGPEPSHQDPEELIKGCQPWGMLSLQYCESLAKGEVFQEAAYDECRRGAGSLPLGAKWRLSCAGAIALCLWMAMPYAVEITGGQNFGEGQRRLTEQSDQS